MHSSDLEANDLAAWIESGVDVQHVSEDEITVSVKMGNVTKRILVMIPLKGWYQQ
jgi:hypothetical protein